MRYLLTAAACLTLWGCSHTPAGSSPSSSASSAAPSAQAIVDAPDRTDADRALDAGRHPAALIEFVGIKPGMKVAELMAGGGYTTELLARAVGPQGVVYGQNPRFDPRVFAEKPWSERLARPINHNVVRVDREFEEPLPPEAQGQVDAVVSNIIYHDTVWMNADRAKMNKAIFQALKPGGVYVVVDSSAKAGTGVSDVKTLHRIDEQVVRSEVLAAGFQLGGREQGVAQRRGRPRLELQPGRRGARRGTSDRFALQVRQASLTHGVTSVEVT